MVRFSDHYIGNGTALFDAAAQRGLEGIVAKLRRSCYLQKRSSEWLKIKIVKRQECVIGGFTDPRGARENFGSLVLGLYDDQGRLIPVGQAGSGFTQETHAGMWKQLHSLETERNSFFGKVESDRRVHYVKPTLVAEIKFSDWTHEGHSGAVKMRAPVFQGLRLDKKATECKFERPAHAASEIAKGESGDRLQATRPGWRSGRSRRNPHLTSLTESLRRCGHDRIAEGLCSAPALEPRTRTGEPATVFARCLYLSPLLSVLLITCCSAPQEKASVSPQASRISETRKAPSAAVFPHAVAAADSATKVLMHNVVLSEPPGLHLRVKWLRGEMLPTRLGNCSSFDEPNSFVLVVQDGIVALKLSDVAMVLNNGGAEGFVPRQRFAGRARQTVEAQRHLAQGSSSADRDVLPTSLAPLLNGQIHLHVAKLRIPSNCRSKVC